MSALAIGELVKQVLADPAARWKSAKWPCAKRPADYCCRRRSSPAGPARSGSADSGGGDERGAGDQQRRSASSNGPEPPSPLAAAPKISRARPAAAAAGRRARRLRGRPAVKAATGHGQGRQSSGADAERDQRSVAPVHPCPATSTRHMASSNSGAKVSQWANILASAILSSATPCRANWSSTPAARSGSISRSIGRRAAVKAAIHSARRRSGRAIAHRARPRTAQGRDQQEEGDGQPGPARQSAADITPDERADHAPSRNSDRLAQRRCDAISTAPPPWRCASISASSRARPSSSRPLSGSSSSHSDVLEAATRASEALATARRQQAHRHRRQRGQPQRFHGVAYCFRPSAQSCPEQQGPAEAAFAVEREGVVGQRQLGPLDPSGPGQAGRQQGGSGSTCPRHWGRPSAGRQPQVEVQA